MNDAQIKHMTERFLSWKLPANFRPDNGISFKPTYNEHMPFGPQFHNPSGTNLFNYDQAQEMIHHMLEGLPASTSPVAVPVSEEMANALKGLIALYEDDEGAADLPQIIAAKAALTAALAVPDKGVQGNA